jgi:hypothetical protein
MGVVFIDMCSLLGFVVRRKRPKFKRGVHERTRGQTGVSGVSITVEYRVFTAFSFLTEREST